MADAAAGAAGGGGDPFTGFLSGWLTVFSLFGGLMMGVLVPILGWANKKRKSRLLEKKSKTRQEIMDIASEVQAPIVSRLTTVEDLIAKVNETSEAINENLEKYNAGFDYMKQNLQQLKDNQTALNIRTEFVTKFFQDNIQLRQGISGPALGSHGPALGSQGRTLNHRKTTGAAKPVSKHYDHKSSLRINHDVEQDEDNELIDYGDDGE